MKTYSTNLSSNPFWAKNIYHMISCCQEMLLCMHTICMCFCMHVFWWHMTCIHAFIYRCMRKQLDVCVYVCLWMNNLCPSRKNRTCRSCWSSTPELSETLQRLWCFGWLRCLTWKLTNNINYISTWVLSASWIS